MRTKSTRFGELPQDSGVTNISRYVLGDIHSVLLTFATDNTEPCCKQGWWQTHFEQDDTFSSPHPPTYRQESCSIPSLYSHRQPNFRDSPAIFYPVPSMTDPITCLERQSNAIPVQCIFFKRTCQFLDHTHTLEDLAHICANATPFKV
jgi:hypothetical protein